MTGDPGDDLKDLIGQAEREAARAVVRPLRPNRTGAGRWIGALALAAVTIYAARSIWMTFAPPSVHEMARDLETVVDQARASIEEARSETGRLPDELPNPSLAGIVVYEPGTSNYRLSATIMGVRVTLQSDGKKTTETGVGQ